MDKLILIGGGGHCISCIDTIEETGNYEILGILDTPNKLGDQILNCNIIGTDEDISKYQHYGCQFFLTVGQVSSGDTLRKKLFNRLKEHNIQLPVIISNDAIVSKHAEIGEGTVIMPGARVNAGAIIESNCIINSNALVEHGSKIESHTHISTGAIVNGDCIVSESCFIGSGSILRNGISVIKNTTIGMGSVVTKNIIYPGIYVGIPARLSK